MNVVAAGMESDESDSDLVFTPINYKRNSDAKRKDYDSEFVSVPKSSIDAKKFEKYDNTKDHTLESPRPWKQNNTRKYQQNGPVNKWRDKRTSVQRAVVLDDFRYAVMQGNLDIVKHIVENKGIYVDIILKAGWTPLMYASSSAHPDIVLYLLGKGADPNYHCDMYTALMAVCASSKDNEENLLETCKHLIKFGANVNTNERHLTTPLMFAAREGHTKIVMELVNAEANIHKRDNKGRSALSWAAASGHGVIVRLLLNQGSDPHEVDNCGQTAADQARHAGHEEVAAVLERCSRQKTSDSQLLEVGELLTESVPKSKQAIIKSLSSNTVPELQSKYCEKQGELELFLNGIGLPNFVDTFKDQHLAFNDLLVMKDDDLEKMGITQIGVRKKILQASRATHQKEWEKTSLPDFKEYQYISCPDAVAMMANIAKHLKYISSTVVYVRSQIQVQPRILEIAQETASVHDLLDEMEDGLVNITHLNDELRFFKVYLQKIQDDAAYVPGDLIIDESSVPARSVATKRMFVLTVISLTVGGILWKRPTSLTQCLSFIQSRIKFSLER